MIYLYGLCKECDNEVEVACDGNNPLFCPLCRSIDTIDEILEGANND